MVLQPHGEQPFASAPVSIGGSVSQNPAQEWSHAVADFLGAVAHALRGPVMFLTEAAVVLSMGGLVIAALDYFWSHL